MRFQFCSKNISSLNFDFVQKIVKNSKLFLFWANQQTPLFVRIKTALTVGPQVQALAIFSLNGAPFNLDFVKEIVEKILNWAKLGRLADTPICPYWPGLWGPRYMIWQFSAKNRPLSICILYMKFL